MSEFRLLYLKYKEKIRVYNEALQSISLRSIIENEEDAWIKKRNKDLDA